MDVNSFFDKGALMDDIDLGGTLLIDFTLGAKIDLEAIRSSNYASATNDLHIQVNNLEATAFVRGEDLSLDFPLQLRDASSSLVTFGLTQGLLQMELSGENIFRCQTVVFLFLPFVLSRPVPLLRAGSVQGVALKKAFYTKLVSGFCV